MIAAVVFSLLTAGAPPAVVATQDDPPVRITLNNDRHFRRGDRAKVHVRVDDDGYLFVLHADPDGRVRVLFPLDPSDDNFVRGGRSYEIRGRGDREAFSVDVSSGNGAVYAAVSRDPFRFDGFVTGDHWDARAFSDEPLQRDPEPELNELVGRMATGRFEYDLVSYDVGERSTTVVYAPTVVRGSYYDPFCDRYTLYSYDCDPYYHSGSRVSIHIGFGRPYYRYRPVYWYDPYDRDIYRYGGSYYGYYDSYYNYRPYYPVYRYPAPYYNRPRYSYPGHRFAGTTPFDIKQRDRRWDGLTSRDRTGASTKQATHTVYGEPPSRRTVTAGVAGGEPKLDPIPAERARPYPSEGRRATGSGDERPSIESRRVEPNRGDSKATDRRSRGIVAVPEPTSREADRPKAPERREAEPVRAEPKREVQREPQLERRQPEPERHEARPERRESQPERREAQPERREAPPQRQMQPERREAPRSAPAPRSSGGSSGGGGRRRT